MKVLEIEGNEYGTLTVMHRVGSDIHGKSTFFCTCTCGGSIVARGRDLIDGFVASCGCRKRGPLKGKGFKKAPFTTA